ncbi:MAG: adenylyltransferase/cytidyltransferase family protein [Acidobacteriia bacterium]|nr:adenylyltransferase/cytidyltransferase family protein [Terriglobia bacterium]
MVEVEIVLKAPGRCRKLGVFPGSFHPITRAHMALAQAALAHVDEVLFVLPRQFPHKQYEEVALEQRMEILTRALHGEDRFSAGISSGGLFIEMTRECGEHYPEAAQIWLLCGRDAAERIIHWDYREEISLPDQLKEFGLLVASRLGAYAPPDRLRDRIRTLPLPEDYDQISATLIRRRIRAGETWEHLVPDASRELVRRHYAQRELP